MKMPYRPKKRRRWDTLADRLPQTRRVVGVEVGVWQAKMSIRMLSMMPELTLYLVDAWQAAQPGTSFAESGAEMAAYPQEKFDDARTVALSRVEQFGRRAKVIEMQSEDAAAEIKRRRVKIDFVFIDGDHSYEGAKQDIEAWWPVVRNGGMLCGHDYANKRGEVQRAVDEFFAPKGLPVDVDDDHTWFVVKPDAAGE